MRLWIFVLSLTLLTGSAYGSITFWLGLLGLLPPPVPPQIIAPPPIVGGMGGMGGLPFMGGPNGLGILGGPNGQQNCAQPC